MKFRDLKDSEKKTLKISTGVFIEGIVPEGSAKKAGVNKGDVLIGINTDQVSSRQDAVDYCQSVRPGKEATFTISRKKKVMKIKIVADNEDPETLKHMYFDYDYLGVVLTDKTMNEKSSSIDVVSVFPKSPAIKVGLKKGYVISKINDQNVNTVNDIIEILKNTKNGDKITIFAFLVSKSEDKITLSFIKNEEITVGVPDED